MGTTLALPDVFSPRCAVACLAEEDEEDDDDAAADVEGRPTVAGVIDDFVFATVSGSVELSMHHSPLCRAS
jgi:hypothetical protein